MAKDFKEGMKVILKNTKDYLNTDKKIIGKIKKIYKYTDSEYKYKVSIASGVCVFCKKNELKQYKENKNVKNKR